MLRTLACLLALTVSADAAEYVLSSKSIAKDKQTVMHRLTGKVINPNPSDPDWQAYQTWLANPSNVPDPNPEVFNNSQRGVQVQSATNPALNGLYETSSGPLELIGLITGYINAFQSVPGGGTTVPWPDANGITHNFTKQDWLNFAQAIDDYVVAVRLLGKDPPQPLVMH